MTNREKGSGWALRAAKDHRSSTRRPAQLPCRVSGFVQLAYSDLEPKRSQKFLCATTEAVQYGWRKATCGIPVIWAVEAKEQLPRYMRQVLYPGDRLNAKRALECFRSKWKAIYPDAVRCLEKDFDALVVLLEFPELE